MSQLNFSNYKSYKILDKATPRVYQSKIMQDILTRLKEILRSDENKAKSLSGSTPIYPKLTSALIEAATGSGKTSTMGFSLEEIWKTKNRFNQINILNQFPSLNILVLNDRIGLVEQLRNELVHGSVDEDKKTIKQPILSDEFIKNLAVKTYHSKADNDESYKYNGSTEIEVDDETSMQATDSMHFATLQTAKTEAAHKLIGQPNVIIVDEADIVSIGANFAYGEYMDTLMSYYVPDKHGNYPIILAMTATPDNITKDIFGEPTSRFPLAEYLASERGPEVQMYIETPPVEDQTLIPSILADIQHAKTVVDYEAKKQMIAEIGKRIDSLFPDRETPEQKEAYLERAVLSICDKIDDGDRSMIFTESISDTDYITKRINEIKGSTIAVARHSDNPESVTDTMQNLKNGTMPVVVSVGQLIRGIDVPSVDNIFSLVNTASAKKYIQLFGRGMRGKAVKFYDYGCSVENLARAGDIYTEYKEYRKKTEGGGGDEGGDEVGGDLELYVNDLEYEQSDSHQVNILRLLEQYQELNLPEIGEDGRVIIDGVEYQRVGESTPSEQLWGVNSQTVMDVISKKRLSTKDISQRGRLNGNVVKIYQLSYLEDILSDYFNIVDLNGRVIIDGVEYQRVGESTPSEQLWGLTPRIVLKRIEDAGIERNYKHRKKGFKSILVNVYEANTLFNLLENDVKMAKLEENGRVIIDGVEYQRVGSLTPSKQLWGVNGATALLRIKKQSNDWKEKFTRNVKSKRQPVLVCNRLILKEILQDFTHPKINANGRVVIDGVEYQRVGSKTPSQNLFGFNGQKVVRDISKQSELRKKKFLKKAQGKRGEIDVCEINALKNLLGIE